MKHLIGALTVCTVLVAAGNARALQGTAIGYCDGATHVITIEGFTIRQVDGEFTGLVLVRDAIGVCRASVTLPDPPLPFDPQPGPDGWNYTATAILPAPDEAAVHRYTPYGIRPDGRLEVLHAQCDADDRPDAWVACDDVPLARGIVAIDPMSIGTGTPAYVIGNCEDDCWTRSIGTYLDEDTFSALAGEPASGLLGVTVDVYGTRNYCVMPGGDYDTVTRIARTPGNGCGAVPGETAVWGGLKAMFR